VTVPGKPENGGTVARFSTWMMHVPVDVPANGGLTVAFEARPFGSNVTDNVPVPAGLPATLQAATSGKSAATDRFAITGSKRSVAFGVLVPVAPFANSDAKSPAGADVPAGGAAGASPVASLVVVAVLAGAASAVVVAVGAGAVGITVGMGGGAGFPPSAMAAAAPPPISTTAPMTSGTLLRGRGNSVMLTGLGTSGTERATALAAALPNADGGAGA
jgi:hypothetical protein